MDSRDLAARARRAYELGRVRTALATQWPIAPIVGVAALLGDSTTALALAVPLSALCFTLAYVGRGLARAVRPGLLAGAVPMLVALTMREHGGCAGGCSTVCAPLCVSAGVLVGIWLGTTMRRRERVTVTAASLVVAALTASLGCAPFGLGSLLGATAGLCIGLAPTWALRRASP